jgi:cytochrome b561
MGRHRESAHDASERSLNQARVRYTRVAIILHWLIAVLIVMNVVAGLTADSLPDAWVRPVIDTHKSIGLTVLGLALLRLLWRFSHAPPPLPSVYPRWERVAANTGHGLLYLVMIALPVTGWMHDSAWNAAATHPMRWFNWFEVPRIAMIADLDPAVKESLHTLFGQFHTWAGYALYALVAVHIGAALKHQFIDKEAELQRMSL